jgi:succinyl-diaminopimelate desuccinylase
MYNSLETILAKLVAIPSVSADSSACHDIIDFVRSEVEPYGLFIQSETNTSNPWFIATTKDTKEPDILLMAHLDVVPAPSELFVMNKHEGKIYGRGVYDMKVAAACYLEFIQKHSDELHSLNIGFLFNTDEETSSASMPRIIADGWRPKLIFLPDGGDNWTVEKRAKGLYDLKIAVHGKTAHGSRPWEGSNALHTLMDVLAILRTEYPSTSHSDATLMVNILEGGEAANQLPGYAAASIDFRSFDRHEIARYQTYISELAAEHQLEVTLLHVGDPLIFNSEAPVVQDFLRILEEERGQEVEFCDSYGASDARFFAAYDIPAIIIEPRGGGRHANEEWLEADDLPRYYQLIERWLLEKPQ